MRFMRYVQRYQVISNESYTFNNNKYIVTHGFTKKTQKTPIKEIIRAKQIKSEFEEEYYANKNLR